MPRSGLVQRCVPPNTYPPSRRVLGGFASGTRRARGPVPVIADVRKIKRKLICQKLADF